VNGKSSLQFKRSPWKHLGLLLLFFVMAGVSYYATRSEDPVYRGIGWVGVIFFALGVVASVRLLLIGGAPPIVMDETGFTYQGLTGIIPWDQVAECYVAWLQVNVNANLCFQLKQPELLLHRLSKAGQRVSQLNKAWGLGDLALSFVGLSPSIEKAVDFIRGRGIEVREKRLL